MRAGRSFTQSSVSALTPLFPASMPDQVDATSPPRGVVAPSPVTTTLLSSVPTVIGSSVIVPPDPAGVLVHVVDDVLDRLQVLELVVGDLHAELVLRRHRDLDHGQRVDVEVVNEALLRGHFVGGHTRDLIDDLPETLEDLLLAQCHLPAISYRFFRAVTGVCGPASHAGPEPG